MREIKFRAWSADDKVMFYPRCNDNFMYLIADKPSPVYPEFKDVIQQGHLQSWMNRQEYIMQYTGLKDKNGKEIYEGDIMYSDQIGNYLVNWHSIETEEGWNISRYDANTDEVIGNIYENPELVK